MTDKAATFARPAPLTSGEGASLARRNLLAGLGALGGALFAMTPAATPAKAAVSPETLQEIGTVWWVELVSADMAKAAGFYSSAIGWQTNTVALADSARPPMKDEASYTLFLTHGSEVAGGQTIELETPSKSKPMWIVYFQVANVDQAVEKAVAAGGQVLLAAYDVPAMARLAVLTDIDGTPFGVASPL
jgi:predicted enzyme related to lactoylglutathione lyase